MKAQFLLDIQVFVTFEEIPLELRSVQLEPHWHPLCAGIKLDLEKEGTK